MLPFFKRSERYEGGASEYHGASGELGVSDLRNDHPYCAGLARRRRRSRASRAPPTSTARTTDGLGRYQLTLRGRWRCDAATAFLAPVRARPNLTVADRRARDARVVERGRARGVEWVERAGALHDARAPAREVILAAGALQSPQLLQLSGIGPATLLRAHGIAVVADAPEVGATCRTTTRRASIVS